MWDGICFGLLLMQRRLFCSFYFQHLVTEMKAQTKLASRWVCVWEGGVGKKNELVVELGFIIIRPVYKTRSSFYKLCLNLYRGAELIAELMRQEIAEQQAAEREVLNKIKEKMERIKASQQLVQNQQIREPASHYEGMSQSPRIYSVYIMS